VLEIGSAKGYFLAVLKTLGWTVFGVEISAVAGKFAREKFNIPVCTGTLEEYAAQPNYESWPLVLAFDVLEHVTDPDDFIAQLNRVTITGGVVILVTPNGGSANIGSLQAAWSGFNPFHIFIFNSENLKQLLTRHGFEVQKIFSYNNTRLTRETVPGSTQNFWIVFAIKCLKKIGLIHWLKNIRLKYWSFLDEGSRNLYLEAVVTEIQKQGNYFSTPDSQAELAQIGAGDNLVIIAKKR